MRLVAEAADREKATREAAQREIMALETSRLWKEQEEARKV